MKRVSLLSSVKRHCPILNAFAITAFVPGSAFAQMNTVDVGICKLDLAKSTYSPVHYGRVSAKCAWQLIEFIAFLYVVSCPPSAVIGVGGERVS
jgi:hypothetical protein